MLRRLVPAHRELLLADEVELRRRIPDDLPEVLRLDHWHHLEPLQDPPPSQNETFRQIADVLARGDIARYAPTMPPNTHWSNWAESGFL